MAAAAATTVIPARAGPGGDSPYTLTRLVELPGNIRGDLHGFLELLKEAGGGRNPFVTWRVPFPNRLAHHDNLRHQAMKFSHIRFGEVLAGQLKRRQSSWRTHTQVPDSKIDKQTDHVASVRSGRPPDTAPLARIVLGAIRNVNDRFRLKDR